MGPRKVAVSADGRLRRRSSRRDRPPQARPAVTTREPGDLPPRCANETPSYRSQFSVTWQFRPPNRGGNTHPNFARIAPKSAAASPPPGRPIRVCQVLRRASSVNESLRREEPPCCGGSFSQWLSSVWLCSGSGANPGRVARRALIPIPFDGPAGTRSRTEEVALAASSVTHSGHWLKGRRSRLRYGRNGRLKNANLRNQSRGDFF